MTTPFIYASTDTSMTTFGTLATSPSSTPIVTSGLPADPGPPPVSPNPSETVYQVDPQALTLLNQPGTTAPGYAPGPGWSNAQNLALLNLNSQWKTDPNARLSPDTSYTGSDLTVVIEVANSGVNGVAPRASKQLVELTTLTVSVHRVKSPVVATGYINVKGWARGRRTIAGTMVLTKFATDVLYEFLTSNAFTSDLSKDTAYSKIDQLPPFNISMLFADEYGRASSQRLLGVEFVTSGDVYSIQDMISEQTISYVAADFTPLAPLASNQLYQPSNLPTAMAQQRTVGDVLAPTTNSSTLFSGIGNSGTVA